MNFDFLFHIYFTLLLIPFISETMVCPCSLAGHQCSGKRELLGSDLASGNALSTMNLYPLDGAQTIFLINSSNEAIDRTTSGLTNGDNDYVRRVCERNNNSQELLYTECERMTSV